MSPIFFRNLAIIKVMLQGICRLFPPFAKMNVTKINLFISLFRDVVHSKVNTGERESLSGIVQSETLSTNL